MHTIVGGKLEDLAPGMDFAAADATRRQWLLCVVLARGTDDKVIEAAVVNGSYRLWFDRETGLVHEKNAAANGFPADTYRIVFIGTKDRAYDDYNDRIAEIEALCSEDLTVTSAHAATVPARKRPLRGQSRSA